MKTQVQIGIDMERVIRNGHRVFDVVDEAVSGWAEARIKRIEAEHPGETEEAQQARLRMGVEALLGQVIAFRAHGIGVETSLAEHPQMEITPEILAQLEPIAAVMVANRIATVEAMMAEAELEGGRA